MGTGENNEQLFLNLNGDSQNKNPEAVKAFELRRAVLAWLLSHNPSGFAVNVPTRILKYRADIAAFWSLPRKKILRPSKTVIIEIRNSREVCWTECSRKEELLPKLRDLKEQKKVIQEKIKENEPALRDNDILFSEYQEWDFSKSKSKEYQRCCKQINEVEHALYKGSRFEQIRSSSTAEFLYLAVPEGSVEPDELADGWGLLYVEKNKKIRVVKDAEKWVCPEENRFHLIQNIAASTRSSTLLVNGLRENAKGNVVFAPLPRRKRVCKDQPVSE